MLPPADYIQIVTDFQRYSIQYDGSK